MPENTNESAIAGPALAPAASPVSTKIPVPMITPTPKTVSWIGPSSLRSWCSDSSVSAMDCSMVFVRNRFMLHLCSSGPGQFQHGPEPTSPTSSPAHVQRKPRASPAGTRDVAGHRGGCRHVEGVDAAGHRDHRPHVGRLHPAPGEAVALGSHQQSHAGLAADCLLDV